ncbi:MAG: hypothetical protein RBT36_01610 [Desulfobulbus sp.]|nr:hypothetical protein [Desulfobulbus sp.]
MPVAILTCTVVSRRFLIEKIKKTDPYLHNDGNFLMGDTQLWAELSTLSKIHFIKESFSTHRILEESASNSKNVKNNISFQISSNNLMLYLCNKYNLTSSLVSVYEAKIQNNKLDLAFYEMDSSLAEEVRRRKKKFTWTQWIKFFGSKYKIVNIFLSFGYLCKNLKLNKNAKWN